MIGMGSLWSRFWDWITGKDKAEDYEFESMENKAVDSFLNAAGLPVKSTLNFGLGNSHMKDDPRPQSAEAIFGHLIPQLEPDATSPIASASNVINYDENKSALENMFGYAVDNNSASAYSSFLENKHQQEMADTAIARAIADAESQGISKYQLFQGGNMAAATPSSSGSLWNSYEKTMDRRESYSEKELAAIVAIVTATMSSAARMIGSL